MATSASSSKGDASHSSQLAKPRASEHHDAVTGWFSDPFLNIAMTPFDAFGRMPRFGELMKMPEMESMKLDIKESDSQFQIRADVPGFAKDQVKVEVDADNVLHISLDRKAEKKEEGEREGWKFHRMERSSASQYRAVKLPSNADASKITAQCENGVLNVTIGKTAGTTSDRRTITVA